jgi:hypothetical protein
MPSAFTTYDSAICVAGTRAISVGSAFTSFAKFSRMRVSLGRSRRARPAAPCALAHQVVRAFRARVGRRRIEAGARDPGERRFVGERWRGTEWGECEGGVRSRLKWWEREGAPDCPRRAHRVVLGRELSERAELEWQSEGCLQPLLAGQLHGIPPAQL